jgi:hypothetical protein
MSVSRLLLCQGLVWEGSARTQAHERWLADQRFEERGLAVAYEEAVAAVESVRARREALDAAIASAAATEPWAAIVGRLACLRATSVKVVYERLRSIRFTDAQLAMSWGVTSSGSSSSIRVAGVSLASEPALM